MGWGEVLASQMWKSEFDLQFTHKSLVLWQVPTITVVGRQRQEVIWGLLTVKLAVPISVRGSVSKRINK